MVWSCDGRPNEHMHADSKKRRSFLALLFAAGDVRRWPAKEGIVSSELDHFGDSIMKNLRDRAVSKFHRLAKGQSNAPSLQALQYGLSGFTSEGSIPKFLLKRAPILFRHWTEGGSPP